MKKKFNEIRVINVVGKYLAQYQGNGNWDMNPGVFNHVQFEFVYKKHKDSIIDWFKDRQWIMKSCIADRKDDICFPETMSQFLECLRQTEISDDNIILFDNYKAANSHNTVPYETGKKINYDQLVLIAKVKFVLELQDKMDEIYQKNNSATFDECVK
jgi:hypothetical protein